MTLKFHTVLKFVALLIFSFEILAPAIVTKPSFEKNNVTQFSVNENANQNQLYFLTTEELDGNEEGGAVRKECTSFTFTFHFNSELPQQVISSSLNNFIPNSVKISGLRLFLRNRILLI